MIVMSFVGIDSVVLKQKPLRFKRNERKSLIGVGVEVKNIEKFKQECEKAFEQIFDEFGCEFKRPVYCSRDFLEIFQINDDIIAEINLLEKFKNLVLDQVDKVHFFYTYFFKIDQISVFGASPNYKKVPVSGKKGEQDFFDIIGSSYPMYCAWKLQKNFGGEIFVDNFQGRVSPAWSLISREKFNVLFHGDKCNHLVATADIFTRLLKLKLFPNDICFLEKEVNTLCEGEFGKKYETHFLGEKYLKNIAPNESKRIITHKLIGHPVYFIAKEDSEDIDEQKVIESSPTFNKIVKKISTSKGCFKYYEKGNDERIMKKGDFFVCFGAKGEEQYNKLKKLGYEIEKF